MNKKLLLIVWMVGLILTAVNLIFIFNKDEIEIVTENIEETITKKELDEACPYTSNVGWTECIFVLLDKKASEREWKMLKLENLTRDEVNTYRMMGDIENHVMAIKEWREGFEDYRDKWCETNGIFYAGSGTPGTISYCKLHLEILAIEQLDSLHTKLVELTLSNAIKDFEPTKEHLVKIMNNNKTFRGCVWAGENKCEDMEYIMSDF